MKVRSSGARLRVWLTGFLFLGVIAAIAALGARAGIEAELESRASERLAEAGLSWLEVSVSGRDAMLKGAVFSDAEKKRAVDEVEGIWGIGSVESQLQVAVRQKPNSIAIVRSEDRLKLRGSVPNEEALKTVIGMANANFPGLDISTKLETDPNMTDPERWLTGVGFGLSQLKHVSSGRSVLAGADLSFRGLAAKPGAYELLTEAFTEKAPQGISVKHEVTPPKAAPYTWTIRRDADQVILGGYAPSKVAKASMVWLANQLFPGASVVDRTVIANGEPQDWLAAARLAVEVLDHLRSGSVTLGPSEVKVEGVAKSPDSAQAISGFKDAVPPGFNFRESVRFSDWAPARLVPKRTEVLGPPWYRT